jgi:methyltransferase family protein
MQTLRHIKTRRAELRKHLNVGERFEQLQESCVPSYLHSNPAAAGVAWLRIVNAARMYRRFGKPGPILDFGAATGELFHMLRTDQPCSFCEIDDALAEALVSMNPRASRLRLEDLRPASFQTIFALDSLEHNDNVGALLDALKAALTPSGNLILSGPTENWLYRTGRRIAGFSGHYHKTTIRHIEQAARERLRLVHRRSVPFGTPLFSISVWSR